MKSAWVASLVALPLMSFPLHGQKAFSVEAGFLSAFEDAALLVGVRSTVVRVGGAGVDFSLGTLPQTLGEGVVLLPNLDLTTAAPVGPQAWLLPRFGVSALIGVAEGGGGGVFGINLGIGLLGRVSEKTGVRLDATYMRYFGDGDSLGLTALTFGFAWMK